MDHMHRAVGVIDRAPGDLEQLVGEGCGVEGFDLATLNLQQEFLLQCVILLLGLGGQCDLVVSIVTRWHVEVVITQHGETEIGEAVLDLPLGLRLQLELGELVGAALVEVDPLVFPRTHPEPLAIVEDADLREQVEVGVGRGGPGKPPDRVELVAVHPQSVEPLRGVRLGEAEFVDEQDIDGQFGLGLALEILRHKTVVFPCDLAIAIALDAMLALA